MAGGEIQRLRAAAAAGGDLGVRRIGQLAHESAWRKTPPAARASSSSTFVPCGRPVGPFSGPAPWGCRLGLGGSWGSAATSRPAPRSTGAEARNLVGIRGRQAFRLSQQRGLVPRHRSRPEPTEVAARAAAERTTRLLYRHAQGLRLANARVSTFSGIRRGPPHSGAAGRRGTFPRAISSIAVQREFSITQSAVSQHLRVLRDNRFATVRIDGSRPYLRARPCPAAGGPTNWLDRFRVFLGTAASRPLPRRIARGQAQEASSGSSLERNRSG